MFRNMIYWMVLVAAGMWCAVVVCTPLLATIDARAASIGYRMLSFVCHQDPHRSFELAGHPMAACIRCTSIYLAFFAGALLAPIVARRLPPSTIVLWCIAVLPMAADALLDTLGWHPSSTPARMFTGSLFGIISGVILTPLLIEALGQQWNSRNPTLEKCR